MTIAEIHGKISRSGTNVSERMEDLLTSNVFGCLRYLPPGIALLPYLRTGRSLQGKELAVEANVVQLHASFWPWLSLSGRAACQPDVVLGLETPTNLLHLVVVEAKYHSGLSSEEDDGVAPNNQLARELDYLDIATPTDFGWRHDLQISQRSLLFVTQDYRMPRVELEGAIDEFQIKRKKKAEIFWTSWRLLPRILESALRTESDQGRPAVIEDMHELLERKNLVMFHGIELNTRRFSPSDFEFFKASSEVYQWPSTFEYPRSLPDYVYQVVDVD